MLFLGESSLYNLCNSTPREVFFMLWAIIIFLVKVIVVIILFIIGLYVISKCKNTVRESGFDISDMSKPDSQLHWTLILIGAGGLCIALNALFKLFGWN